MSVEASKVKKSGMRKRGVGIYQKNILFKQIAIPFNKIGNNIAELISIKLSTEMEGKCITEGFIKV